MLEKFTSEQVSKTIDMRLEKIDSNEYFDFFISAGNAVLNQIELRVPGPKANTGDGLLIMKINPVLNVKISDIIERFGAPVPDFVTSDQGEMIGLYYCYDHPGGKINFKISEDQDRVLEAVIDRTGR